MTNWRMGSYRDIFQYEAFRFFWLGFTFSAIGDAMTRIAFIWFVYQSTGSPQAVGWLLLYYTGPVDRRKVMLIDNTVRGTVMAIIPLSYFFHMLALWHIYLVAVIYGFLTMITLAGGPSLVPSMVSRQHLAPANALGTLSYTLSGVLGPPVAGLLIASFGTPSVLVIDALSYATLALALTKIHVTDERMTQLKSMGTHSRLKDAISLLQ